LLALLVCAGCVSGKPSAGTSVAAGCDYSYGGLIRGPTDQRRIALVFTGHTYGESAGTILDELARHHAHGSFFLTGAFLTNAEFTPLVRRMKGEGHYLGPHSDAHLLYCDWNARQKTLVTREQFDADLRANVAKLPAPFSRSSNAARFFLPAFEYYNSEIANWSAGDGFTLVNFTPGTRANADYTGETDANFVSSQTIFDSIVKRERDDPRGLNGFILLLHAGSGPGRADKFADKFGSLLDNLGAKGYQFVRIDELLTGCPPP
jgi:peptidoglycan/xylan/chitin deacetylase (PgdA/CDA1 family)